MAHPRLVWMPAEMRDFWSRNQSRPDATFVRSIPGRSVHLDPAKIPPQDRDIHLVVIKSCPDTNPFPTLEAASAQHASTLDRLAA
eukprot:1142705-Pelagomonas_calceolata.AAC.3